MTYDTPFVYDSNGKQIGLNWEVIKQRFLENCSTEEREAQLRRMTFQPRPVAKKAVVKQRSQSQPTRLPPDKIALIKSYYEVGNKVSWIAKEMNLTDRTVRKYLVETGVYKPGRDSTRKKS